MLQDEQIASLADRYYGELLQAGEQGLSANPVVDLTAPAQGRVLWSSGRALEGYEVGKISWEGTFPDDRANFERIGFSPAAQWKGIWVLMGVRYEEAPDGPAAPRRPSHAFAHYDPPARIWTVVRQRPGASRSDEWTARWLPADGNLTGGEKAVIARVAGETAMLMDAAVTLKDDPEAYFRLTNTLMQRARESADPGDIRRIGAVLRPSEYLAEPVASRFRISAFGRLERLAIPLYRALAGKPQRNSDGLTTAAATGGLTLWPQYEPGDYGLSRASGLLPPPSPRKPPGRRRGDPPGRAASR